MHSRHGLQVLSLKNNPLRNLGCQKVFKALTHSNQTLTELDLESTSLGDPAGPVSILRLATWTATNRVLAKLRRHRKRLSFCMTNPHQMERSTHIISSQKLEAEYVMDVDKKVTSQLAKGVFDSRLLCRTQSERRDSGHDPCPAFEPDQVLDRFQIPSTDLEQPACASVSQAPASCNSYRTRFVAGNRGVPAAEHFSYEAEPRIQPTDHCVGPSCGWTCTKWVSAGEPRFIAF